jgi:hypothetical protein
MRFGFSPVAPVNKLGQHHQYVATRGFGGLSQLHSLRRGKTGNPSYERGAMPDLVFALPKHFNFLRQGQGWTFAERA